MKFRLTNNDLQFNEEVHKLTSVDPYECYQCGKCAAGCPVAEELDFTPTQIMRFVQLGLKDKVLNSHAIWVCASCQTCTTRCPQGVEIARVMEGLRIMAQDAGIDSPESDVDLFSKLFLGTVRTYGRAFEFEMAGKYNLLSGHLFKDVGLAMKMGPKGKLKFLPPGGARSALVKMIFTKSKAFSLGKEDE